jgi:hypothetical protein
MLLDLGWKGICFSQRTTGREGARTCTNIPCAQTVVTARAGYYKLLSGEREWSLDFEPSGMRAGRRPEGGNYEVG